MSWTETLLDASFRGVPLQVLDENLQAQRALAQHGTPYRDGDSVEDLGRGARLFSLRVVMFGPNYELELQNLLRALDTIGPGELVHPIYGSITVVAGDWQIQHVADRPDYAEVSLKFLEHLPDEPFFDRLIEFVDIGVLEQADAATWQDGLFDLLGRIDTLAAQIQVWIGGGWVGLIEQVLDLPGIGLRLQQLRSQILGVVSNVGALARSPASGFDPLVDLVRTPTEIRSAIQTSTPSEARTLLARDGIPASMPGSGSLTAEAARAGSEVLGAARQGVAVDARLLPAQMPTDPIASIGLGLVVLVVTELAVAHAQAAAVLIEDEADTPTLNPDELERLVNLARALIQGAILLQRRLHDVETARPVAETLRNMAALLQARARQALLQRPPMVERVVEAPTSLRLLAHRWYGDHTRANELLRLNPALRRPHNIKAGEVLRAYAQ